MQLLVLSWPNFTSFFRKRFGYSWCVVCLIWNKGTWWLTEKASLLECSHAGLYPGHLWYFFNNDSLTLYWVQFIRLLVVRWFLMCGLETLRGPWGNTRWSKIKQRKTLTSGSWHHLGAYHGWTGNNKACWEIFITYPVLHWKHTV